MIQLATEVEHNLDNSLNKEPASSEPDARLAEFLNEKGLVIPNKYLAPHIQNVIDKWETGLRPALPRKSRVSGGADYEIKQQLEYSRLHTVADVCHMGPAKLKQILSGEGFSMFRTADRVLSALDLTHLWYEDENLALAYSLS